MYENLLTDSSTATNGQVAISFYVNKRGKVCAEKVIRSLNKNADQEAIRVLKLLQFYPVMKNGRVVRKHTSIYIDFNPGYYMDADRSKSCNCHKRKKP